MKSYPPDKIKNIAIIGHGHTGKTTLADALLYSAKAISRIGSVDNGSCVCDSDAEEIKRKISIYLALAPLEYKNYKINLIDTPGYTDFVGEALAALRVADSVMIVLDAISGCGVGVDKLYERARKENLPAICIVNRLDKSQADFGNAIASGRKKLGNHLAPVEIPIGKETNFSGVVDLIKMKAIAYKDGIAQETEIPEDLKDDAEKYKEMLIEAAAEVDDTLLTDYLDGKPISEEELMAAIRKGVQEGKVVPIFCASAVKNIGILPILDLIIEWMPSADSKGKLGSPFLAYVFKTVVEPHVGEISYARIYSGKVAPSSSLYNISEGKEERIGQILALRGKTRIELTEASAGDIVVFPKLKITKTGDTLGVHGQNTLLPKTQYPEPAISLAVKPKSKADQEKMSLGLGALSHEDPTFKMHYDPETKESIISGMGDIHLEVMLAKLKERYGVDIETGEPRIPYKETIKAKSKAQGKYKKQTGGRGQYGDTWIEIEPLERGKGFEFVNKIVGGAIPRNYIPSVEKGIREAMDMGVVAGYHAVDIRVTLFDGSYHEVDSSDMAFKIAGSMGFKKAVQDAKPTILEPIMQIEVYAPADLIGNVTGDLNKRRGRIVSIESDKVVAIVPLAEIANYATTLRSFTHGQGTFTTHFSHYEEAPIPVQQKLIAIYTQKKAEGELIQH